MGEAEAASRGGEDLEVEGVEELLDVEEQRGGGRGCPRATGRRDLGGGRLPPYDVGGGLQLSRAENGRVPGEGRLPGSGARLDDGAEDTVERGEDPDGP